MDRITEDALALLRADGRLSFSEMARRLGTTRAAIASRIGPRLDSGELRIVAAVHPRQLGLEVLAHVSVQVRGDVGSVARLITERTPAVFVSETVGPFELILEVHSRSVAQLQETLQEIRRIPEVIDVHFHLYEQVLTSFFLDAEPDTLEHELDDVDIALIDLLQLDGRTTYPDLARAVGLSITATRARVLSMLESGLMRIAALGQRGDASGSLTFGLGVTMQQPGSEAIAAISARRGLDFMARTVGRFDLIATVPFASLAESTAFVAELRTMPGVTSVTAWLHAKRWHERYQAAQLL